MTLIIKSKKGKKMKKILLFGLIGIMTVGVATALPSQSDRHNNCEGRKGMVWVQKTGECISINPCADDNEQIRDDYCKETQGAVSSMRVVRFAVDRYAQNVLKTNFTQITDLGYHDSVAYYGAWTSDGQYYGFQFDRAYAEDPTGQWRTACWAYGKNSDIQASYTQFECRDVTDVNQCDAIAIFASFLDEKSVRGDFENGVCKLTAETGEILMDGVIVSPK